METEKSNIESQGIRDQIVSGKFLYDEDNVRKTNKEIEDAAIKILKENGVSEEGIDKTIKIALRRSIENDESTKRILVNYVLGAQKNESIVEKEPEKNEITPKEGVSTEAIPKTLTEAEISPESQGDSEKTLEESRMIEEVGGSQLYEIEKPVLTMEPTNAYEGLQGREFMEMYEDQKGRVRLRKQIENARAEVMKLGRNYGLLIKDLETLDRDNEIPGWKAFNNEVKYFKDNILGKDTGRPAPDTYVVQYRYKAMFVAAERLYRSIYEYAMSQAEVDDNGDGEIVKELSAAMTKAGSKKPEKKIEYEIKKDGTVTTLESTRTKDASEQQDEISTPESKLNKYEKKRRKAEKKYHEGTGELEGDHMGMGGGETDEDILRAEKLKRVTLAKTPTTPDVEKVLNDQEQLASALNKAAKDLEGIDSNIPGYTDITQALTELQKVADEFPEQLSEDQKNEIMGKLEKIDAFIKKPVAIEDVNPGLDAYDREAFDEFFDKVEGRLEGMNSADPRIKEVRELLKVIQQFSAELTSENKNSVSEEQQREIEKTVEDIFILIKEVEKEEGVESAVEDAQIGLYKFLEEAQLEVQKFDEENPDTKELVILLKKLQNNAGGYVSTNPDKVVIADIHDTWKQADELLYALLAESPNTNISLAEKHTRAQEFLAEFDEKMGELPENDEFTADIHRLRDEMEQHAAAFEGEEDGENWKSFKEKGIQANDLIIASLGGENSEDKSEYENARTEWKEAREEWKTLKEAYEVEIKKHYDDFSKNNTLGELFANADDKKQDGLLQLEEAYLESRKRYLGAVKNVLGARQQQSESEGKDAKFKYNENVQAAAANRFVVDVVKQRYELKREAVYENRSNVMKMAERIFTFMGGKSEIVGKEFKNKNILRTATGLLVVGGGVTLGVMAAPATAAVAGIAAAGAAGGVFAGGGYLGSIVAGAMGALGGNVVSDKSYYHLFTKKRERAANADVTQAQETVTTDNLALLEDAVEKTHTKLKKSERNKTAVTTAATVAGGLAGGIYGGGLVDNVIDSVNPQTIQSDTPVIEKGNATEVAAETNTTTFEDDSDTESTDTASNQESDKTGGTTGTEAATAATIPPETYTVPKGANRWNLLEGDVTGVERADSLKSMSLAERNTALDGFFDKINAQNSEGLELRNRLGIDNSPPPLYADEPAGYLPAGSEMNLAELQNAFKEYVEGSTAPATDHRLDEINTTNYTDEASTDSLQDAPSKDQITGDLSSREGVAPSEGSATPVTEIPKATEESLGDITTPVAIGAAAITSGAIARSASGGNEGGPKTHPEPAAIEVVNQNEPIAEIVDIQTPEIQTAIQSIVEEVQGETGGGFLSALGLGEQKINNFESAMKELTIEMIDNVNGNSELKIRTLGDRNLDSDGWEQWTNFIKNNESAVGILPNETLEHFVGRVAEHRKVVTTPAVQPAT